MKLLCTLYFILVTPLLLFLGTLLYGGITNTVVKEQLLSAQVYEGVETFIQDAAPEDESEEIVNIVKKRLTTDFIQSKSENAIDDSFSYIRGDTTTQPVLSLKEIKEDIMAQNPELLKEIEQMSDEMEAQRAQAESAQAGTDTVVVSSPEADTITALLKNDFELPYADSLNSMKQTHQILTILVPFLAVLAISSILALVYLNKTMPSRFRWLSIAFLGAGIIGFGSVLSLAALTTTLNGFLTANTNEVAAIFTPFLIAIITKVVETYGRYQTMANYAFLLTGVICIVGMFVMKEQKIASTTGIKTKKK